MVGVPEDQVAGVGGVPLGERGRKRRSDVPVVEHLDRCPGADQHAEEARVARFVLEFREVRPPERGRILAGAESRFEVFTLIGGERGEGPVARLADAPGHRAPRRDGGVKDVSVGDEDQPVGHVQVADVADERVVVARQERQLDAVLLTQIEQTQCLAGGVRAVPGMMDLGDVAVDDEALGTLPDRAQGIRRGRRPMCSTEVQVGENDRAMGHGMVSSSYRLFSGPDWGGGESGPSTLDAPPRGT